MLRLTERFGEREGKKKYLELRQRLRAGEDVSGENSDVIDLVRKSIRSVKWS